MNQNKSALDRLKEIEAEKKELEAALLADKGSVEFPIYCKQDDIHYFKVISKKEGLTIAVGKHIDARISYTDNNNTYVNCNEWTYYLQGAEVITPEEFEAARTEAINKLSTL